MLYIDITSYEDMPEILRFFKKGDKSGKLEKSGKECNGFREE